MTFTSSGGTGAAVGASFAAAGMGSDTCGSIRIPAANQNLVGLRGTHGLSSRDGVMPLSSTQDIAGPLARSVTDLAIMLDATVGADPNDPITADGASHIPRSYRDALNPDGLKGARIGCCARCGGTRPKTTRWPASCASRWIASRPTALRWWISPCPVSTTCCATAA
ncbi:MAG TPA: amidase family protein [Gemmatimonadaceae bacterium]|nr:amidase family protein [Gemmatimonadaceae bacterium]